MYDGLKGRALRALEPQYIENALKVFASMVQDIRQGGRLMRSIRIQNVVVTLSVVPRGARHKARSSESLPQTHKSVWYSGLI